MSKPIFVGSMASLDNVLDALCNARKDWIKNDRVSLAIKRAIQELQTARGKAADDINRSLGIRVTIK